VCCSVRVLRLACWLFGTTLRDPSFVSGHAGLARSLGTQPWHVPWHAGLARLHVPWHAGLARLHVPWHAGLARLHVPWHAALARLHVPWHACCTFLVAEGALGRGLARHARPAAGAMGQSPAHGQCTGRNARPAAALHSLLLSSLQALSCVVSCIVSCVVSCVVSSTVSCGVATLLAQAPASYATRHSATRHSAYATRSRAAARETEGASEGSSEVAKARARERETYSVRQSVWGGGPAGRGSAWWWRRRLRAPSRPRSGPRAASPCRAPVPHTKRQGHITPRHKRAEQGQGPRHATPRHATPRHATPPCQDPRLAPQARASSHAGLTLP
jgi:hypothetical protein